ncbi:nuclear transport factor 2 family protein [Flavitalea sp. BT771]|uniref:nuclear transport factor 2 family protein n=1 Tax=Flavitalea sp. BT771 TaxID=3063329 RepID=UPI0026E3270B|nr:nuclear transport factor 2 family protein [Flavitalea sp. BT771]MDO6431728.1 nuclear transport factor 2 family protein [Flavitalea sp. BT771]MDV6220636.1 nuclear transport factor 2 family protein [Flavitalea sp. BT771]
MIKEKSAALSRTSAKEVVLTCIKALNAGDLKAARSCVNDDMEFDGVLGARHGADAYFQDMEKMRLKYHIRKAFEDGDDVCLLYDLEISGKTIFGCGWYHLQRGKISHLKVVFDPRPLLEQQS